MSFHNHDTDDFEAKEKECEYWKQRCEAAEEIFYISGVVNSEGYVKWQQLKNQTPNQ